MNYEDWVHRWPAAAAELHEMLMPQCDVLPKAFGPEAAVQNAVRLEASRAGARLWRNNVGAGHVQESGSFLRWGLCNDSPTVNKNLKSGDLIGIRPIVITPSHLGRKIGQFLSREVKAPDWKYTGTAREVAQAKWAELINSLGGDAAIVNGTGSLT